MKVKVCGLTDRQNIEAVLSLRPDHVGLIFYAGSKRFAAQDDTLAAWLRPLKGIGKTGVFVNETEAVIMKTATAYGLDYVQLHGEETAAFCARLQAVMPVIKAFPLHAAF